MVHKIKRPESHQNRK